MWIANANGGVWRTHERAGRGQPATPAYEGPAWEYVSETVRAQQRRVAGARSQRHRATRRSGRARASPTPAAAAARWASASTVSKNGGKGWKGPLGAEHFFGRAVGSIEVKPGDSKTIFAASGPRACAACRTPAAAAPTRCIPGAPHFGLYRSQDEGKTLGARQPGRDRALHRVAPRRRLRSTRPPARRAAPAASRSTRWTRTRSTRPSSPAASGGRGRTATPGRGSRSSPASGPATGNAERAEFDVVALPSGETRMYVGVGRRRHRRPLCRRSDAVRTPPAAAVQASLTILTNFVADTPGYSSFGYCDGQCSLRQLRLRARHQCAPLRRQPRRRLPLRRQPVQREQHRQRALERPRGAALDGRRRDLHRHDRGQPQQHPSRARSIPIITRWWSTRATGSSSSTSATAA